MFVVGGGNYIEYQNLLEYCRRGQFAKKITYGTSELMNARQFLHQVNILLLGCTICACMCVVRFTPQKGHELADTYTLVRGFFFT